MLLSLRIGSAPISVGDLMSMMIGRGNSSAPLLQDILLEVRMPRILLSFLVGLALGASGTVMQSLLQNPLASSYTLGVSSGASLGASTVMLFGINFMSPSISMSLAGFAFGLVTVVIVLLFAQQFSQALENQTIYYFGGNGIFFVCEFLFNLNDDFFAGLYATYHFLAIREFFGGFMGKRTAPCFAFYL